MKVVKIIVNNSVPAMLLARAEPIHMIDDVSLTAYVRIKA